MHWNTLITFVLLALQADAQVGPPGGPSFADFMRFSCSQLNIQRLDPLVFPGGIPSPHLHQIVGGNAFTPTLDPSGNFTQAATCTTCLFTDDVSNYWTATLYFQHRNGSFKRVPLKANQWLDSQRGGMTVYYTAPYDKTTKVTAFAPGFRMLMGDPFKRVAEPGSLEYQNTAFRCWTEPFGPQAPNSPIGGEGDTRFLPEQLCEYGIRANNFFPTCWDGVNLDSADHKSHVAYPIKGSFDTAGDCPDTHPVKLPQLMYEVLWDTSEFTDKSTWPEGVTQPFVFSQGDATGFGWHADYVFGWKGDALQRAMDNYCGVDCPIIARQTIEEANECALASVVEEPIDGWLEKLPGDNPVTYAGHSTFPDELKA